MKKLSTLLLFSLAHLFPACGQTLDRAANLDRSRARLHGRDLPSHPLIARDEALWRKAGSPSSQSSAL